MHHHYLPQPPLDLHRQTILLIRFLRRREMLLRILIRRLMDTIRFIIHKHLPCTWPRSRTIRMPCRTGARDAQVLVPLAISNFRPLLCPCPHLICMVGPQCPWPIRCHRDSLCRFRHQAPAILVGDLHHNSPSARSITIASRPEMSGLTLVQSRDESNWGNRQWGTNLVGFWKHAKQPVPQANWPRRFVKKLKTRAVLAKRPVV